jgi:nucleoid-associated protein EbfC
LTHVRIGKPVPTLPEHNLKVAHVRIGKPVSTLPEHALERKTMADFLGLMKQAAELKSKMEAMQAELDKIEVEGSAGAGLVTVRLSAKGEMRGLQVDGSLMKPDEKEIVEDLVIAAHADARRKAESLVQDKMKALTGGLPLPPGLSF